MAIRTAYLALGANIGDTRENMRKAVKLLDEHEGIRVIKASSLYLTRPVGLSDQPDFLNAVIAVETTLSPRKLLEACLDIEKRMGRRRTIRWGPRVIDIDILLYNGVTLDEDDLKIPHPVMLERAFVLAPLAEIAPDVEVAPGLAARDAASRVGSEGIRRLEEKWWAE